MNGTSYLGRPETKGTREPSLCMVVKCHARNHDTRRTVKREGHQGGRWTLD